MNKRLKELGAMMMVGDGVLGMATPERHCRLWQVGPEPWQQLVEQFAERPGLTRLLGAAEVALGLWLAAHQKSGRQPSP
jgi:hypothetical protein